MNNKSKESRKQYFKVGKKIIFNYILYNSITQIRDN